MIFHHSFLTHVANLWNGVTKIKKPYFSRALHDKLFITTSTLPHWRINPKAVIFAKGISIFRSRNSELEKGVVFTTEPKINSIYSRYTLWCNYAGWKTMHVGTVMSLRYLLYYSMYYRAKTWPCPMKAWSTVLYLYVVKYILWMLVLLPSRSWRGAWSSIYGRPEVQFYGGP